MNRRILTGQARVGRPRAEGARESLPRFNARIEVEVVEGITLLAGMDNARAGCFVHGHARTMAMRTSRPRRRPNRAVFGNPRREEVP